MSDRYFLDTNVFVYCFDREDRLKQQKANAMVQQALRDGLGMKKRGLPALPTRFLFENALGTDASIAVRMRLLGRKLDRAAQRFQHLLGAQLRPRVFARPPKLRPRLMCGCFRGLCCGCFHV